jgi:hypothetical protein
MLAKRTWRGVLMCVCGVSFVIILELEFYSNEQGIAVLRSSIGPGLADTVVKPRCSAGELRQPIFQIDCRWAQEITSNKSGASGPVLSENSSSICDLDIGGRQQLLVVAISIVNAIELIDARYWNG